MKGEKKTEEKLHEKTKLENNQKNSAVSSTTRGTLIKDNNQICSVVHQ